MSVGRASEAKYFFPAADWHQGLPEEFAKFGYSWDRAVVHGRPQLHGCSLPLICPGCTVLTAFLVTGWGRCIFEFSCMSFLLCFHLCASVFTPVLQNFLSRRTPEQKQENRTIFDPFFKTNFSSLRSASCANFVSRNPSPPTS